MNEFNASLSDIRKVLDHFKIGAIVTGNQDLCARRAAPLSESSSETIAFSRSPDPLGVLEVRALAGIVIVGHLNAEAAEEVDNRADVLIIGCQHPEAIFYAVLLEVSKRARDIGEFMPSPVTLELEHRQPNGSRIFIDNDVLLADNVRIGAFCSVRRCTIGEMSELQAGVRVGDDALGAVVGPNGEWIDRPHFAGVVIGRNVRIENNSVIQAGFLNATTISDNCRIGPLTWIGNGVSIGQGTLIGQSVTIAGSVTIGRNCRIWSNASIREAVTIGDGVTVGMGAAVVTDIPSNEVWFGNPARKRLSITPTSPGE
jgi:UDP-3-O-[3-hydroxymyristoyl] glucosamine N-acyltransferase